MHFDTQLADGISNRSDQKFFFLLYASDIFKLKWSFKSLQRHYNLGHYDVNFV